ncbi:MAG: hypothetical protein LBJ16_01445 [Holosporaceae bacterium]|jgi:hypothetical protein|nr:hypothetical protein [Holosporaceae bacterium]
MKIIFDWCDPPTQEKTPWRGDLQLISLEITHRECGFAAAKAIVTAKDLANMPAGKCARIGALLRGNMETIFLGRLVSFPIGLGNSCLKLEFISEPDNYAQQLDIFCQENLRQYREVNKHAPTADIIKFDDLFFSAKDWKNPTTFLEGDNKVFYWDMKTGKMSLSHINGGTKNFEISGKDMLQNSLRIRLSREPYRGVNLHLSANWIQHTQGCIDLFPLVAEQFRNGVVNSLTNIKSGLEKLCKFSSASGYGLVRCNIMEIFPTQRDFFRNFPTVSREFKVGESSLSSPGKSIKFKRFYFNGCLLIDWRHRQKIVENVTLKITTKSQLGREKDIYLKLGDLQLPKSIPDWEYFHSYRGQQKIIYRGQLFECLEAHVSADKFDDTKWKFSSKIPDALADETADSFFKTDRGKNAIRYAMQKAIALINHSRRFIEIEFSVYAKNFLLATLEDQITIVDQRFPSGRMLGKITKIVFSADANQRIMRFTIACNVAGFSEVPSEKLDSYFQNLSLGVEENKIEAGDIVTQILVENLPEEQEEILQQSGAKTVVDLRAELKKHPTKIKILLHPLSTTRVVSKDIKLPDFLI